MADQDNYEGIDFRVRKTIRPATRLPMFWWTVAGIAIVSFVLLLLQVRDAHDQRKLVLKLQEINEARAIQIKKAIDDNHSLQKQIDESNALVQKLKEELAKCSKHTSGIRTESNHPTVENPRNQAPK